MTLQPETWAGVKRLRLAKVAALLRKSGSLAPRIWIELVSAIPLGKTTNSTAMLSPGCSFDGAGRSRGLPTKWANGSASSEMYLERLSAIAEQRSSSAGETATACGPRAHAT